MYSRVLLSLSGLSCQRPPTSSLFPYTTLFRSHPSGWACSTAAPCTASPPRRWRRSAWTSTSTGPSASSASPASSWSRRSEEHTSELQSRGHLVCRLLLEKKKQTIQRCHDTFLH